MGGLRPSIASPRGDCAKTALAPRAVAEVKALWLLPAGRPKTGRPRAVAGVRALWLRWQAARKTPLPRAVVGVESSREAWDPAGSCSTLRDVMRRTLIVTNDFPPRQGGIQSFVHELALRLDPDQLTVYAPKWDGDAAFDAAQPFEVVRHPTSLMIGGPSVRRRAAALARSTEGRGGHLRRLGPPGADHAGAPQGRRAAGDRDHPRPRGRLGRAAGRQAAAAPHRRAGPTS